MATGVMLALVLGTYKRANWSSDVNIAYTVTMRDAFALGKSAHFTLVCDIPRITCLSPLILIWTIKKPLSRPTWLNLH